MIKNITSIDVPVTFEGCQGLLQYPIEMHGENNACIIVKVENNWLKVDKLVGLVKRAIDISFMSIGGQPKTLYILQVQGEKTHYAQAKRNGHRVTISYLNENDFSRITGVRYDPNRLTEKAIEAIAKITGSALKTQEQIHEVVIDGEMAADVAKVYGISSAAVSQAIKRYKRTNEIILNTFGAANPDRHFKKVKSKKDLYDSLQQAQGVLDE